MKTATTPRDILEQARRDGVEVLPGSAPGTVKLRGDAQAVKRWAAILAPHKPELVALLAEAANDPAPTTAQPSASGRTCRQCAHQTKAGTCSRPVEAGLSERFGIRWPAPDHAERCPAFEPRAQQAPADPWREHLARPANDAELALMARRVARFEALGMPPERADHTADRLLARDREGDTRQLCAECAACRFDAFTETWRCSSRMGMAGALQRIFVTEQLQRCPGFSLSRHLRPEEGDRHA